MVTSGEAQTTTAHPRDPVGNTPWWLISAGIHVVVLLTTTLLFIESRFLVSAPDEVLQVSASPPRLVARDWRGRADVSSQDLAGRDQVAVDDECVLNFPSWSGGEFTAKTSGPRVVLGVGGTHTWS